jgi:hypothetical protein
MFSLSDILQEVSILLWGNEEDIPPYFCFPSNYTINNAGTKSAFIKSTTHWKCVRDIILLKEFADSIQETTMCGRELKNNAYGGDAYRVLILCQIKRTGWIPGYMILELVTKNTWKIMENLSWRSFAATYQNHYSGNEHWPSSSHAWRVTT